MHTRQHRQLRIFWTKTTYSLSSPYEEPLPNREKNYYTLKVPIIKSTRKNFQSLYQGTLAVCDVFFFSNVQCKIYILLL